MKRINGLVAVVGVGAIAGSAIGQVRASFGGAQSFGGVQNNGMGTQGAAFPGPISGLGGVRAEFPTANSPGPFISPLRFGPMPVGPWPGVVINGNQGQNRPGQVVPRSQGMGPSRFTTPGFNTNGFVANANGHSNGFFDSSGFFFNGSFNGDRFRLRIHIGSDPALLIPPQFRRVNCGVPPVVCWFPNWWYGDALGFYDYGNRYGTFYGNYSAPDPNMGPAPAPAPVTEAVRPSTDRELGDTFLRGGDARAAIKMYKSFLKQRPGDEDTMRALGLALIESGQTAEGVAMISMAYRAEPLLAKHPVPADLFANGDDSVHRNLERVSIYANRVKSAPGWLAVAVLMQAEGRTTLAATMLDRAKAAGLEPGVYDRMSAALK